MMAILIQPCIPPMFESLNEEKGERTPKNFSIALKRAFLFLFCLFSVFSTIGYLSFGQNVHGNVLQDLPLYAWYSISARFLMAIVCVSVYPLMIAPITKNLVFIILINISAALVSGYCVK